jgi:hypothetical protein
MDADVIAPRNPDMKLINTTHEEQAKKDRQYWLSRMPEERLIHVEDLRIEAGKFLYDEYPSRLRRIITVTHRAPHVPCDTNAAEMMQEKDEARE